MQNVSASVIPLPTTVRDLVRSKPATRTLHDMVEELYLRLYDNSRFHALNEAVYRSQAVEGSIDADDHEAARMTRELANEINSPVKNEKLATIVKSLRFVARRYNQSRKERRNTLGGTILPSTTIEE